MSEHGSDLERRIARLEARLNGQIWVSHELFDVIVRELRQDIEDERHERFEMRKERSAFRLMVAGSIIGATLSLAVSVLVLVVKGLA